MPELPEVETIVRQIAGDLRGVTLGPVRHLRRDIVRGRRQGLGRGRGAARALRERLGGTVVRAVSRRGKRVVLDLGPEMRLVFGLGMSGHLAVLPAAAPVAKHTHLRIALGRGDRELRFRDPRRFGGIWLLDGADDRAGFARLGVEPLEMDLRVFRRLLARPRCIKALLMDQAMIAGLGNIYCDESLHRAGVHPLARAADIPPERVKRLHRAIRRVLAEAIAAEGTTIASYLTARGEQGSFQRRLRVYGRHGAPCRKCGTAIERLRIGGRSTHFCPTCQRR